MAVFDTRRSPDENEEQYIWRLGNAKDLGQLELDWNDVAYLVNKEFRVSEDDYKTEAAYRKAYQQAKRFYEAGVFKELTGDDHIKAIQDGVRDLKKEKVKLQTEKLEYNKWLREEARDELITEQIVSAINSLPPVTIDRDSVLFESASSPRDVEGVLCIGDEHYGAEFKIVGLHGEVINEYNPDVFEARMNKLAAETIKKGKDLGLTKLKIYSLGDQTDGILRTSQLMNLRYGVVESTVRYSEFICQWLATLAGVFDVEYFSTEGNHTELRMIGQPKGTFTNDNVAKIINQFIKVRFEGSPYLTVNENPTGLIYEKIFDTNVLGIHGEVANLAAAISDFSNVYNTNIDVLIGAHKHHSAAEDVGIFKEVVSVPSIMGTDGFSMKLKKCSNPGAKFLVFEDGLGLTQQHKIIL